MRIAVTSDTHYGHTKKAALVKMFKHMATEQPDVVVHAGDWAGMHAFPHSVQHTMDALRRAMPMVPVIGVTGNHDYWVHNENRRTEMALHQQLQAGFEIGQNAGLQWLYFGGGTVIDGVAFVGCMGWYANPMPGTNDTNYMPGINHGGPVHGRMRFLEQQNFDTALMIAEQQILASNQVVCVTHFPIVFPGGLTHGDQQYGGDPAWGDAMRAFGVQHFINGHAHQRHEGAPMSDGARKWEAGSDYGKPRYVIIDL